MKNKKKTIITWCLLIFVIFPLVFFVFCLCHRSYQNSILAKQCAELRAEGYPTTLKELDDWYPYVADEKNAAIFYLKGYDASKSFLDIEPNDQSVASHPASDFVPKGFRDKVIFAGYATVPPYGEKLIPEYRKASQKYLKNQADALLFFRKGAALEKCRFPIDLKQGYKSTTNHFGSVREAVSLIAVETFLAAEDNNSDKCYINLIDSLNISAALKDEPNTISYLVLFGCYFRTFKSLKKALNLTEFNSEQLASLKKKISQINFARQENRAYAGEIAPFKDTDWRNASGKANGNSFLMSVWDFSGIVSLNKVKFIEIIKKYLDATREPVGIKSSQAMRKIDLPEQQPQYFLAAKMLMPFCFIHKTTLKLEAQRRTIMTGLAVELYRKKYKKLPSSIEQLVPEFLTEIPEDPFSGNPLKLYVGDFELHVI